MENRGKKFFGWQLPVFAALLLGVTSAGAQAQYYPPAQSGAWESVTPAALSWNDGALTETLSWLEAEDTRAFVVLKGGRIAVEAYFHGFDADSTWIWYSAGKSLMSALVGKAADEGLLSLDDATSLHLGRWTLMSRAREDAITVRHQLSMSTGLNDQGLFSCTLRACLTYRVDAGQRWAYHNAPYSLLRDVLEAASGEDINTFLEGRLGATGIQGRWEESGFNNFYYSTARSAARFGLLVARGGVWDGEAILPPDFVEQMIEPSQEHNPSYGYLWWLNGQEGYIAPGDSVRVAGPIAPSAPPDVFSAAGAQGQFVSVAPSLDLVVVRLGSGGGGLVPLEFHDEIWQRVMAIVGGTGTGVGAVPEREVLSVFPNPASSSVEVRGLDPSGSVHLFDAVGRRISVPQAMGARSAALDVSRLSPGVYFVVAVGPAGARTVRPVVVR